jgi:hypothetical protein
MKIFRNIFLILVILFFIKAVARYFAWYYDFEVIQPTIAGWDGFNNLSHEQKAFTIISGAALFVAILVALLKPKKKREGDFLGDLGGKFATVSEDEGIAIMITFSELVQSPEKFIDIPKVVVKGGRVVYVFRTDDKAIALVASGNPSNLNVQVPNLSVVIFDIENPIDAGDDIDEAEGVIRKGEVEGRKIFYFEVMNCYGKKNIPKEYRSILEDICQAAEIEFEEQ